MNTFYSPQLCRFRDWSVSCFAPHLSQSRPNHSSLLLLPSLPLSAHPSLPLSVPPSIFPRPAPPPSLPLSLPLLVPAYDPQHRLSSRGDPAPVTPFHAPLPSRSKLSGENACRVRVPAVPRDTPHREAAGHGQPQNDLKQSMIQP